MPTVAAIAPKPLPTCRHLPFPLTTFNLGGCNALMCFRLKPAPLNISPVLLLVGREVMVRLFGSHSSSYSKNKLIYRVQIRKVRCFCMLVAM